MDKSHFPLMPDIKEEGGVWSFMCLELIMQGFITGFHGSRHHTLCLYNDGIIGTDKTNLEKS